MHPSFDGTNEPIIKCTENDGNRNAVNLHSPHHVSPLGIQNYFEDPVAVATRLLLHGSNCRVFVNMVDVTMEIVFQRVARISKCHHLHHFGVFHPCSTGSLAAELRSLAVCCRAPSVSWPYPIPLLLPEGGCPSGIPNEMVGEMDMSDVLLIFGRF